ncbi:MAG: hydroxyacylglutathione hydrolase C-terminal domain-containing protein [Bdellovibrionota bacterium]
MGQFKKLSTLPEQTKIYCAHEYTLSNAHFAVSIDSENELLAERYRSICSIREKGLPTVPTTLKEELETNPFLRADTLSLQKKLGMEGVDPAIVFAEIRKRKDSFRL